jgi:hypothetical protein
MCFCRAYLWGRCHFCHAYLWVRRHFCHAYLWVRIRGKGGRLMVATTNRCPPLPLMLTGTLLHLPKNSEFRIPNSEFRPAREILKCWLARGRAGRGYAKRRFVVATMRSLAYPLPAQREKISSTAASSADLPAWRQLHRRFAAICGYSAMPKTLACKVPNTMAATCSNSNRASGERSTPPTKGMARRMGVRAGATRRSIRSDR